jgi:hypothetical protein
MKLALDLHGVINSKPEFFASLSKLFVENGHEIHILTGSHETPELHEELKSYGIFYTHFLSIADYNKSIGTHVWYDEKNTPWMDEDAWNRTKGDYCKKYDIDLCIDDTIKYGDYFKTPFARFFSKHIPLKVREIKEEINAK